MQKRISVQVGLQIRYKTTVNINIMFCHPNIEHFDSAQYDNSNNDFPNCKSVSLSGVEDFYQSQNK